MGKTRKISRAAIHPSASPSLHPEVSRRPIAWASLAAIALLTVIAYAPALRAGYVWDDVALTKNATIRARDGLVDIWFNPSTNLKEEHYWPIVYSTFWLEDKLWGMHPAGYHAVNVLLHLANALLLWRLLLLLEIRGAWLAAAIFAVHPVHVESVAWIIERKDTLSGLFYLGAAICFLKFASGGRISFYAASVALLVCAMLSKSVAVTLPVALGLVLWWRNGRITSRDYLSLAPLLLLALLIALLDLAYDHSRITFDAGLSLTERIHVAGRSYWFYISKLFWPSNLMTIYPRWSLDGTLVGIAFAVALAAVLYLLWGMKSHWGRGPLAAFGFFLLTLAPTSGILSYGFMKHSFVADRFQYLASIGPIALLVALGAAISTLLAKHSPFRQAAAAALLLTFGLLTFRQTLLYKNDESLFTYNLTKNPHAPLAYNNLGVSFVDQDKLDEAGEMYQKALDLDPENKDAANNLGVILDKQGKYEEAKKLYSRSLNTDGGSPEALSNMGSVLLDEGRIDEAAQYFSNALQIDRNCVEALTGMGALRVRQSKRAEAEELFSKALQVDPRSAKALTGLGSIHLTEGRIDEALKDFSRGLAIDSKMPDALVGQGLAYIKKGKLDDAIASFNRTLARDPNYAEALNGLASVQQMQGKLDDAIINYKKAIAARPDYVDAFSGLGSAWLQKRNFEEARKAFEKAIALDPNSADAQSNLAGLLLQKGEIPEAVSHLKRALEINPEHANALNNMGLVLGREGKLQEAGVHFRRVLAVDPRNVRGLVNLGGVLLDEGKVDEAVDFLRRALEIDPNQAKALNSLGAARLRQGRATEAITLLKKALAVSPDYAEARANLQKAEDQVSSGNP